MLSIQVTQRVASLLGEAAGCSTIPEAARANAAKFRENDTIAWDDLKTIIDEYRTANPDKAVYLHQLCSTKDIKLQTPAPKEKSPELQARLARLQAELDNKRYAEMVADVTEAERKADEMRNSILPTARLQLSFGVHILVTMFTFWAITYYGSMHYLSYDERWAGLAGALGLTAGMLLETTLLIVRSNRPAPLEETMPELFDKQRVQEAFVVAKQLKEERKAGKAKAAQQPQKEAAAASGSSAGPESKKAR